MAPAFPRSWLALGLCGLGAALALGLASQRPTRARREGVPAVVRAAPDVAQGYLGSGACKSCHGQAYQSWHESYHRTMTREATQLTWDGDRAPTLPVELEAEAGSYVLTRQQDGTIRARGPDLHGGSRAVVERNLVLVTGSHHYLAFWITGPQGRELRQFPFVYLLDSGAWAPRGEVFLAPPRETAQPPSWNANCIQCHAVAGQPGQSEGASPEPWVHYETQLAEQGVACEACHGPGKAHAERMRSPFARQEAHALARTQRDDPHRPALGILNPARLDAAQSSALCGQCHAYFLPRKPDEWWSTGYALRAPVALDYADSRVLLRASSPEVAQKAGLSHELASIFWSDGAVRVGGREYNGLVESPCFQGQGVRQISCNSCHSMHAGAPDDQLRPELAENQLCTSCHGEFVGHEARHSRHAAGSPGSNCLNCHMPKTSYALLKGIRSHRISSPSRNLTDPPSACALCHVDQTATWLDSALTAAFPGLAAAARSNPSASSDAEAADEPPLGVAQLLAGNAAERALFASALGEPGARALVDATWSLQLLARLQDDPYPAVRRIAERVQAQIRATPGSGPSHPQLPPAKLDALEQARDDEPIVISE